jgi:hypothetical protein
MVLNVSAPNCYSFHASAIEFLTIGGYTTSKSIVRIHSSGICEIWNYITGTDTYIPEPVEFWVSWSQNICGKVWYQVKYPSPNYRHAESAQGGTPDTHGSIPTIHTAYRTTNTRIEMVCSVRNAKLLW